MLRLPALLLISLLPFVTAAAPARLDTETAQRDLRILKRALTELHPGVERHLSPAAFDAAFAEANAEVANGADRATMYRLASRLSALLRCGHTWTNPLNQRDDLKAEVFAAADKLPLWIRIVERRALVTASSDPAVRAGDELLAIDGRPISVLIADLLPYLRADGDADGKRLAQLDSDPNGGALDRLLPLVHPPVRGHYQLQLRDAAGHARSRTVAATTVAARDGRLAQRGILPPSEAWSFAVDVNGIARLRLPTFAFWNGRFDWQAELDRAFAVIDGGTVRGLIIDMRHNEGGDDAIGDALLRHLLRAPYIKPEAVPYSRYERVPYILARYLQTWDYDGFFDRTGRVTRLAERRYRYDGRIAAPLRLEPLPNATRVPTAVLTGPEMSSAGFLFARDLQRSGTAWRIGRRTGGDRRGLNGSELTWITLPGSGATVDIPLIAWETVDPQGDGGVEPDQPVAEDFAAARAGRDPDDEAAVRWLAAQRANAG